MPTTRSTQINVQISPTPVTKWSYGKETGPDQWGNLDPLFVECSQGCDQSPIDIAETQRAKLPTYIFNYKATSISLINTGATIGFNYEPGSSIVYDGITYDLVQLHFHRPSEHTINGKAFDLELHLVHQDADGNVAVIGVLITKGKADNPAYAPIFDNLPAQVGTRVVNDHVNALDLLPKDQNYYTYIGSLTTPPCTQGVRWLLLSTPVELSQKQIDAFTAIFHLNARPVQPINNRDVLQGSGN